MIASPTGPLVRDITKPEKKRSDVERFIIAAVGMAAIFHDFGKMTEWFQKKLRERRRLADPIRHELISFMVMKAMYEICGRNDEEWLARMSDESALPGLIMESFDRVFASPDTYLSKDLQSNLREGNERQLSINLSEKLWRENGKFNVVATLVLSHHRLPGGTHSKKFGLSLTWRHLVGTRDDEVVIADFLKSGFRQPSGKPIWKNDRLISVASRQAQALRECRVSDPDRDLKAAMVFGRTSLIMGDHRASSIGNVRYSNGPDGFVYANTNARDGTLAEELPSHLVSVHRTSAAASSLIFRGAEGFPGISTSDIPDAIQSPRSTKGSRFRWQVEAGRCVSRAMSEAGPNAGFFGVLMAGTGSGKTRAAPIIHAAAAKACGEDLRLSVTSGLRTLTLQAGTEYVRELGFSRDDVEVVIGDDLLRRMHDAGVRRNATKDVGTDGQIGDDLLLADGSNTANALALPSTALKSLGGKADGSLARMVASPVLVSTIDTLMSAADARRGRHTAAMMRVATSDLLIDEIDDFANEDIVAIARLVYLSASFGRKVVVASATVTPAITDALFRCYLAGWENHKHVSADGSGCSIVAGWFGEREDVSVCSKIDGLVEFRDSHAKFISKMIEHLKDSDGRRSLEVVRLRDCGTAKEYFEQVTDAFEIAHCKNHVLDEKTGKRLSLGLVRWSNVGTSVFHAKTVMERGFPAHVAVKVVPYNGSLLNVHRNYVERILNPALKRKSVGGRDPILSNPCVRQALDESPSSVTDVIIVVISTSIEEVGRDHDFDWAICEPSSLRSLVQIAGRIRRHRPEKWPSKNLFLLDRCFKERAGIVSGSGNFSYPGPETLSHDKDENRRDLVLKERAIDEVFDVESLSKAVDSTEVIGIDLPKSGMGQLERLVSQHYLTQGSDRGVSVDAFISDPLSLACDFHPSQRKFRRQRGMEVTYVLRGDGHDRNWHRTPFDKGDARDLISCGKKVGRLPLQGEGRLFISMPDDGALIDQAAAELGVESLKQWEEDSFLSISKTDFRDSLMKKEYFYHPSFGFIAKENWMAEFDD